MSLCHLLCTDPGSATDLKIILIENSDFVTDRQAVQYIYVMCQININIRTSTQQFKCNSALGKLVTSVHKISFVSVPLSAGRISESSELLFMRRD